MSARPVTALVAQAYRAQLRTSIPRRQQRERRELQQRHNEARKQRDLLVVGDSAFNSGTFIHLPLPGIAGLPGLPTSLPALVGLPAGSIGREFLSCPRFWRWVFGPYTLIHHERAASTA